MSLLKSPDALTFRNRVKSLSLVSFLVPRSQSPSGVGVGPLLSAFPHMRSFSGLGIGKILSSLASRGLSHISWMQGSMMDIYDCLSSPLMARTLQSLEIELSGDAQGQWSALSLALPKLIALLELRLNLIRLSNIRPSKSYSQV
jgi:hypothetical protein